MRTPMAREPLVSGGNRKLPVDAPRPKTYGDGGDDHHTEKHYEQQSGIHDHQPVERLTFNHLPKNHLIWRASLRFSKMLRKIIAVCCGAWIASHDRLRAEGEVSDFSRSETPQRQQSPCWSGWAVPAVALRCRAGAGLAFGLRETAASLARPGNVSGLEKFFQCFSAKCRDHLRIGYAFDAPEFLEAEEARAVAHERGPVELAHHAAFFGGESGLVQRRFGVVFEDRPVLRGGEAVEESVEPQGLGARGEVEEVGALEFFGALELGVHRKSRFFASLRMTQPRRRRGRVVRRFVPACAKRAVSLRQASRRVPRTAPPPSRWSSAGSSSGGFFSPAAKARRAWRAT